jgi:MFS superfamily sulfate permease-like transporter
MADLQVQSISTILDEDSGELLDAEETAAFRRCRGRAAILHLKGSMSFGAANDMMKRIVSVRPVDVLIIDLSEVPGIDGSTALTLEQIIERAQEAGQEVFVVGMHIGVARMLSRLGALDSVREATRFASRIEAIESAVAVVDSRAGASEAVG